MAKTICADGVISRDTARAGQDRTRTKGLRKLENENNDDNSRSDRRGSERKKEKRGVVLMFKDVVWRGSWCG